MGYYTEVQVGLRVKKEKQDAFQEEIKKLHQETPDWWGHYSDLRLDANGNILFDTYSRKWYDEEKLYEFLAPYVEKENFVIGQGEACGDYWRVLFDGEGKYKMQEPVFADEDMKRLMDAAQELLDACDKLIVYKSIHPEDF